MVPAWSDAMGLTTLQIPSNQKAAGFNPYFSLHVETGLRGERQKISLAMIGI
jgi:hypothetical protein